MQSPSSLLRYAVTFTQGNQGRPPTLREAKESLGYDSLVSVHRDRIELVKLDKVFIPTKYAMVIAPLECKGILHTAYLY